MYEDRTVAGRILGEQVASLGIRLDVVLAVPPRGLNVAQPIAERFDADLRMIVAEPIQAPSMRHGPVGAVTDTGVAWVNNNLVATLNIDEERLDVEKQSAFREARDKHEGYGDVVGDPTPEGTVAVVDDGLVSTVEMKANLSAITQLESSYAVAMAPVGVPSDVTELHVFADDVVVDETPSETKILSHFYESFDRTVLPELSSPDCCHRLPNRQLSWSCV